MRSAKDAAALLALLLCLLLPRMADAAGGAERIEDFSYRVWQARDGLPSSTVQALAQTPDGYLWVGTSNGLSRFDGARFIVFNHLVDQAFQDDSIWSLATGQDGTLWIGTEGGGLIRYRDGVFTVFGLASGLTNLFVRAVCEDRNGILWVGTDRGVFRGKSGRFTRIDGSRGIPVMNVYTIHQAADGTVYVGGSGLLTIRASGMQYYRSQESQADGMIGAVQDARDATLWVGTFAHLRSVKPIHAAGADPFRVGSIASQLLPASAKHIVGRKHSVLHVSAIAEAADGDMWIGTYGDGVLQYRNGVPRWFQSPAYLADNNVNTILSNAQGAVWIGTQNGLVLLEPTGASTLTAEINTPINISSVYSDRRHGDLYAVTLGGKLMRVNGAHLTPVTTIPSANKLAVRTVFRDSHGLFWIGTSGQGIFAWDGVRLQHFASPDYVRTIAEAEDGTLWVGTDGGSWMLRHGVFSACKVPIVQQASTRAFAFDREGVLWLGTDTGLIRLRQGRPIDEPSLRPLQALKVWSLHVDSHGNVWIGTRNNGLYLWNGKALAQFSSANGFPSDSIYSIFEDNLNQIWIGGAEGVWSFDRRQLIDAASRKTFSVKVHSYTSSSGVFLGQMNGGVQFSGTLSASGDLWFASDNGAIRIHPSIAPPLKPLVAHIEQIHLDGVPVAAGTLVRIPANIQQTEITYTALRLASPEQIRFRYRLANLDNRWIEAGSRRVAYFTHMPPGRYRLEVQAYSLESPEETVTVSLELLFLPRFYQTAWFYTLTLACIAAIIALAFLYHRRKLHQRYQAVMAERVRVAREMHDTLIQGCVGISTLLEAASSVESTYPERSRSLVERARTQTQVTVDEARKAVWKLRHQGETEAAELPAMIAEMIHQMSEDTGIAIHFETTKDLPPLPVETRHSILLLIREALLNSLRHASASRIGVTLSSGRKELSLRVEDNGSGFIHEDDSAFHYGMTGMRERVAEMGGELSLFTQPSTGTRVEVKIPLRRPSTFKVS